MQRSDGVVLLMFRDASHGPRRQIGYVWSHDNGYTWSGHILFAYNPRQEQWFSHIGTQGGNDVTVVAGTGGLIVHWQSWDGGASWHGAYPVGTVPGAWDAEMAMGCRGPIFTLTQGEHSIWIKRYDWYSSCE